MVKITQLGNLENIVVFEWQREREIYNVEGRQGTKMSVIQHQIK